MSCQIEIENPIKIGGIRGRKRMCFTTTGMAQCDVDIRISLKNFADRSGAFRGVHDVESAVFKLATIALPLRHRHRWANVGEDQHCPGFEQARDHAFDTDAAQCTSDQNRLVAQINCHHAQISLKRIYSGVCSRVS